MLNAEKYKDEILNISNKGSTVAFDMKKNKPVKCVDLECSDCVFKSCRCSYKGKMKWLLSEYQEPILDDVEKEYLSAVIRPFRNRVRNVRKARLNGLEYICIEIKAYRDYMNTEYISLPYFAKGLMYKGMEPSKKYTLEELGL